MKIPFHVPITAAVLTLFSVSCQPVLSPEFGGVAAGGYVVEIQDIPDISKLDIDRTVMSFSRTVEQPKAFNGANNGVGDYDYIRIFYDSKSSVWFVTARHESPNGTPSSLRNKIGPWGTGVKRFQVDPSQKSLRFWINSLEYTSASEESIAAFRKRISFLSFRLHYNDRIYDGSDLLNFEKGKMSINKNKVTVIQPKPAKAEKFYPPFFIKNPGYILSPGRHVIQFSDLRLVLPTKEVKTK